MDPFRQQELMIWESMVAMGPFDYALFLYQNPVLVEPADQKKINSGFNNLIRYSLATLFGGVALNVLVKKVPGLRFLDWPLALRLVGRAGLLASPLAVTGGPLSRSGQSIESTMGKYLLRLQNFKATKRIKHLDPSGVMFRVPS